MSDKKQLEKQRNRVEALIRADYTDRQIVAKTGCNLRYVRGLILHHTLTSKEKTK